MPTYLSVAANTIVKLHIAASVCGILERNRLEANQACRFDAGGEEMPSVQDGNLYLIWEVGTVSSEYKTTR